MNTTDLKSETSSRYQIEAGQLTLHEETHAVVTVG
jgi:hypothetical protein